MLFSFAVLATSNWCYVVAFLFEQSEATKLKIAYVIKVLGEDQMIALGSVISMEEGIYLQKVTALWSQETVISTFILVCFNCLKFFIHH